LTVLDLDIGYRSRVSYRAPPIGKSGVTGLANLHGFRYVTCLVNAEALNRQNLLAKIDLDLSVVVEMFMKQFLTDVKITDIIRRRPSSSTRA
jgi:hypothetical protein